VVVFDDGVELDELPVPADEPEAPATKE